MAQSAAVMPGKSFPSVRWPQFYCARVSKTQRGRTGRKSWRSWRRLTENLRWTLSALSEVLS
eukprot:5119628-Prorocentrum_lima.AAC.1